MDHMYDFKKVGSQLVVKTSPEESRALKHKLDVFQKHWYQMELKENGLGNIYANLIDRQDLMLVDVRDNLNELEESIWITRINNLLGGLISNIYLVTKGVIFEPYIHPNNFVYSPAVSRILTFYRKDNSLKVVSQSFYEEIYKLIAFLLSKAPVDEYDTMSIVEIEDYMELHQYMLFVKLLDEGSIDKLAKYFLSDTDIDRLDSYLTIVPEGEPAYVRDLRIKITWSNIKFAQTLAEEDEVEPEPTPEPRRRKPTENGLGQKPQQGRPRTQSPKGVKQPISRPRTQEPNPRGKGKKGKGVQEVPMSIKTRKSQLSKEERIQRVRDLEQRKQKTPKIKIVSHSDEIMRRRKMPGSLKFMILLMFALMAVLYYLYITGVI